MKPFFFSSLTCRDEHEFRAIISGLRLLKASLLGQDRRDKRKGFKPEPGRYSLCELRLRTVNGLLKRYDTSTGS